MTSDFESYLNSYLGELKTSDRQGLRVLNESISYSLKSGGKRFRPRLVFTIAKAFDLSPEAVMPWALAVEFIHSYSLIHDDLPSMDNDDLRRGRPTNHKVYGEDIALLAGDALLTEAFQVVAQSQYDAVTVQELVRLLSKNSGLLGMVGGQAIDLRAENNMSFDQLMELHALKTGALIQAAILGVGFIGKRSEIELKSLASIGLEIGLCFQIKDDLLDGHEAREAMKNYVFQMGEEETKELLFKKTESLIRAVKGLFKQPDEIIELIEYNHKRDH